MLRATIPTLESATFKGGIARCIEAMRATYPHEVTVVDLPPKAQYPDIVLAFWRIHRTAELYLIHHVLPVGTVAWLLSFVGSRPYVIFLHGLDFDLARTVPRKAFALRRILRRAKRVVTNSEALKKEVVEWLGQDYLSAEPLVIYPTVSDSFVDASKSCRKGLEPMDLKRVMSLASGAMGLSISSHLSPTPSLVRREGSEPSAVLLTVGRLVERKGHLKVLELLERMPGLTYHIVGDGPLRERIEAEVLHRGLGERVKITSKASDEDLPRIYATADIFVMPTSKSITDREGFGIVYLEAQLFGLPVIATNQPGVDEAVKEGEGGILIDDTPDALEAAARRLIDEPATRSRLGSRGRERVLSTFTRETQMAKLRELLM